MYAVFEFKICAHAYYWPRAVEKMNGQGRQAGADIRQVSEKEKQEFTEVLTKTGLLHCCRVSSTSSIASTRG